MNRNVTWAYEPGHCISLQADGIVLANYVFAPRDAAKPYVHPIHTLSGVPMTAYQPSDHVWHRGLWFAWKYINGVNYWEEAARPEEGGRQFSDGRTSCIGTESLSFRNDAAVVIHAISYTAPDGTETLHEDRRVVVHPPGDNGNFRMDFAHLFTAGKIEVTLDVTTVTPESPWGGYAGLGIRTARSLQRFRALSSEGLEGDKANGSRSRWADLSGVADGGVERSAGVAIFAHPQNPRFPSPTYVYHRPEAFGYLNLNPIRDEPLVLSAHEQLRLAYRVLIHDGGADPRLFDAEHAAFGLEDPFDGFAKQHRKA